MRLEKIKLTGFKSFVDPTTVLLPSNLVAVVGPNGCGKSNIIDAVRWVMGESSARLLRGESMADVIFNGSSNRKPLEHAVIELLFDNSDATIGGQYASYTEIAVKRQVTKDGQSNYYLNNIRCRRRDITELFLGTGLGPRSYSIIEQGTISRLIEARPEELRGFLEEAAGISKYRERRRETETSIRNTRENLERLNDLRDEVNKRLQHLQRQATAAEKYQALRTEEQRRKGELLALRWQDSERQRKTQVQRIKDLESTIATTTTEQEYLESNLEECRNHQQEIGERHNSLQSNYYELATEIARIEETVKFNRESGNRIHKELLQINHERTTLENHIRQDTIQLTELDTALTIQEPALTKLKTTDNTQFLLLEQAEQSMRSWQTAWDEFQHQTTQSTQLAQLERARINHLEQQTVILERRLDRHTEELRQLDQELAQESETNLEMSEQTLQQQVLTAQEHLKQATTKIQELRAKQAEQRQLLDTTKDALQTANNRYSYLDALQHADTGDSEATIKQWLIDQGLDQNPQLLEYIEVSPTWEQAVETVLGTTLQAYCIESLDQYAETLEHLSPGPLQLFETAINNCTVKSAPGELETQVIAPWPLTDLVGSVDTAANLSDALKQRHELDSQQSLITPNGIWVGRNWLKMPDTTPTKRGLLQRSTEQKAIRASINELIKQLESTTTAFEHNQQAIKLSENDKDSTQQALDCLNSELGHIHSDLSVSQAKVSHLRQRRQTVANEILELTQQLTQEKELIAEATERLYTNLESLENLSKQRDDLVTQREQLQNRLERSKIEVKTLQEQVQNLTIEVESTRIRRETLIIGKQRLQQQLTDNTKREAELTTLLTQSEAPTDDLDTQLETLINRKQSVEQQLNSIKTQLATADAAVREGQQTRHKLEQGLRNNRQLLDQLRLVDQELLVKVLMAEEQLKEGNYNLLELLATLPQIVDSKELESELERCTSRLQRLGPLNLAAIAELQEETTRKHYLDTQHEDINHALSTLEGAIRKIDRETKIRFQDTFDRINTQLGIIFPRLFGGGQAYLELSSEELLNAGITVMARPPGKRNSNIHLLSGGEKALTAVALVFAIFQLNPAPFCILDEVDAPLDDANVGRFCDLVRSMAHQVQFIFITHNKVTMELANQLIGVTMHEPGVSRLVTVDMDAAIKLAVT